MRVLDSAGRLKQVTDVTGTLSVGKGGTGVASLAAHGVLIGEGTGAVAVTGAGTAGQVLTSGGASADPAFVAPVTAASGEAVLSATTFNLLAGGLVNGTWYDSDGTATMPSVSLPGAGTYLLYGYGRVVCQANAGQAGNIGFRLYNSTDAAAVANSESMGVLNDTGSRIDATALVLAVVTVAAAKTIKLQAKRDNATTWTLAQVTSDANGRTKIGYVQLAP